MLQQRAVRLVNGHDDPIAIADEFELGDQVQQLVVADEPRHVRPVGPNTRSREHR